MQYLWRCCSRQLCRISWWNLRERKRGCLTSWINVGKSNWICPLWSSFQHCVDLNVIFPPFRTKNIGTCAGEHVLTLADMVFHSQTKIGRWVASQVLSYLTPTWIRSRGFHPIDGTALLPSLTFMGQIAWILPVCLLEGKYLRITPPQQRHTNKYRAILLPQKCLLLFFLSSGTLF